MGHGKYKVFNTKQEALDFQQLIADQIGNGDPYQSNPLYDKDLDQYAIQLVWNYETEIVAVIGQTAYDDAPELVNDGPFYRADKK